MVDARRLIVFAVSVRVGHSGRRLSFGIEEEPFLNSSFLYKASRLAVLLLPCVSAAAGTAPSPAALRQPIEQCEVQAVGQCPCNPETELCGGGVCDPSDPTSWCYEPPCDPTDPTSWCYEPPQPPPGFQVQVFSPALSMAQLNPLLEEHNAAWYEANGYPAPVTPGGGGATLARLACTLPDADWDGDGLVGAADTFPTTLGPFIADFPVLGVGFTGTLTADVALQVSGGTTQTNTLATVDSNSYTHTRSATDTKEIKSAYSYKTGTSTDVDASMDLAKLLKLDFSGLSGKATMKFYSKNDFDFSTSFSRVLKDETVRKIVSDVNHTITTVTTTNTTYDADAGRIRTTFVLENLSTNARNLKVKNLQFLVMAHNPRTGADLTFARAVQVDSNNIVLGGGPTNNRYQGSLIIDDINTNDMLNALNQGWTIEVVAARGYLLLDADTNVELNTLINNVSYRTALLSVNWGGLDAPLKRRVSSYTQTGYCTNIQDFLTNAFGASNITFRTNTAGKLVIDRIHGKQARHDERDFDTLTPAEKNEYGKWVVGMYGHPARHPFMNDAFDLVDTDVYAPFDEVYLYFLTKEDFAPTGGPLVLDYYDDSVGIIPESPGVCPANSQRVWIDMDDEDRNNANWSTPWIGAFVSTNNTRLEFCKVDGERFRRLTDSGSYKYRYAVLKLDENCPVGAVPFQRHFDNEDKDNRNANSGNIWPNTQDGNTTLGFCLFRKDPTRSDRNQGVRHMMSFPDLGVPYGVFVDPEFDSQFLVPGTSRGAIHTDDEDTRNKNSFWAPDGTIDGEARRIVQSDNNTTLITGKVRN